MCYNENKRRRISKEVMGMKRKKLPYGIPNFRSVSQGGYVFVDKTPFVEKLENLGERYEWY